MGPPSSEEILIQTGAQTQETLSLPRPARIPFLLAFERRRQAPAQKAAAEEAHFPITATPERKELKATVEAPAGTPIADPERESPGFLPNGKSR